MGANAARHTLEIIDNTINIVAIELLTAIQAIDLRPDGHERLGQGTGLVHKAIRNKVSFVESDRQLDGDIKTLASMIRDGDLLSEI